MKRVYLVDSENVGDVWVPLLVSLADDEHVVVFYTQKSPHMSYENVRLLKETTREAEFIKCFEGSNALDFQLVTELGYRLNQDTTCEYVIVSNDTGFDAVVRYWTKRGMPVRRLSGKDCHKQLTQLAARKTAAPKSDEQTVDTVMEETDPAANEQSVTEEVSVSETSETSTTETTQKKTRGRGRKATVHAEESAEDISPDIPSEEEESASEEPSAETMTVMESQISDEVTAGEPSTDEPSTEALPVSEPVSEDKKTDVEDASVIADLCSCIGKDNLADFHNALVMLFGEDNGKDKYQEIKSNPEYAAYWKETPVHSQEEKFNIYCRLVFVKSDLAEDEVPADFAGFLWRAKAKRKNLNSLRAALQSHYGKEKGMRYYSLFKSHIKIMNRM
jgi:hypothetical protein